MNRRDLGFWGIELDADAFAQALAAAGVLHAAGEPAVAGADVVALADRLVAIAGVDPVLRWEPLEGPPAGEAATLAGAWARFVQQTGRPLRLEIAAGWRASADSPAWLVEELARPGVDLAAVYVASEGGYERAGWTWPLDVGLLPDDASRALGEELAADHWAGHLVDLAEIGPDHEACDVLLLPYGLREAVTRLLRTPVRASCVLMLGDLGEPWERARPMLETIEAHARCAGLGVLRVPAERRAAWFHELTRELSHDVGLDVALHRAAPGAPPLLIATRPLLESSRMAATGAALGRRMERVAASLPDLDVRSIIADAAASHGMAGMVGAAPPEETLRDLPFDLESRGASVVAAVGRAVRAIPPPAPPPRFLQARVLDPASEDVLTAFRANAPHAIVVRIGPEDVTWTAAETAFPVEELPESDQPHRLRVVFTDLRLERASQVGEISLPKEGPSSEVRFALRTGAAGERIEARIIVLHRNRVLQTVLLRGTVAAGPMEIVTEVIARARLDDLTGRSRFDAALVLNHTDDGLSRLTRIAGERAEVSAPGDIDRAVAVVQAALETFIDDPAETVALEGEQMRALLIGLARQGRTFYDAIVLDQLGEEFAQADRIQIVAAVPEAYLPVEFVYDRVAPKPDAKLCPNARQGLATGRCPDDCRAHAKDASVVCPLGFWCLTKVLERHVHTPERASEVRRDFALLREPVAGRRAIGPLRNATFAASAKVDDFRTGTSAEVVRSLRKVTAARVSQAKTWTKWVADVSKLTPSLLVMLPHTLTDEGIATLEVGKRAHLGAVDIADAHVSVSPDTLPIVLLLGCETGDPALAFQKFPAAFRRHGAAIVLATLTKVLGRHAAPVATRLVTALVAQSRREHVTFGDVMLAMRRELLLDGYPMVLALTAYGDADWRLGAKDA